MPPEKECRNCGKKFRTHRKGPLCNRCMKTEVGQEPGWTRENRPTAPVEEPVGQLSLLGDDAPKPVAKKKSAGKKAKPEKKWSMLDELPGETWEDIFA